MPTYQDALEYLYSFTDMERTPGQPAFGGGDLARVHAFWDRCGRPERAYGAILIAGTKGKGSTANYVAGALRAAGYRTGLYTQPHLTAFRERMQVDGEPISEDRLVELVRWVQPLVAAQHAEAPELGRLTTYEVATAITLQYFAEAGVDYAVLEIGLGGRLDAVNAVRAPLLSLITSLSLDHTKVLGDTLDKIAYEKAGIIRPGTPVVSAPQPSLAAPVLTRIADERQAPLYWVGSDLALALDPPTRDSAAFGAAPTQPQTVTLTPGPRLAAALGPDPIRVALPLAGAHQAINAAVAAAGCGLLRQAGADRLTVAAIQAGFAAVQWPGRLEVAGTHPLLILDGAHNDASAAALAQAVPATFRYRRLVLVLGLLADKDAAAILTPLLPLADSLVFTQSDHPRRATSGEVQNKALQLIADAPNREQITQGGRVDWQTTYDVAEALEAARSLAGPEDAILVTGSLSVVGEARAALGLGLPPDPVRGDFFYRIERPKRERIPISVKEFLRTGEFGPIHLGVARAEMRTLLGLPDNWGTQSDVNAADIWIYGNIEFHFYPGTDHLWLIWNDNLWDQGLWGGRVLAVDSWAVRGRASHATVAHELELAGIGYREIYLPYYEGTSIITEGDVLLSFPTGDDRYGAKAGLGIISRSTESRKDEIPLAKYQFIGRITHFWPRAGAVAIQLEPDNVLHQGERIAFDPDNIHFFVEQVTDSIRVDNQSVAETPLGALITLGVQLNKDQAEKGTRVYRVADS